MFSALLAHYLPIIAFFLIAGGIYLLAAYISWRDK